MRFIESDNRLPEKISISSTFFQNFVDEVNSDFLKFYLCGFYRSKLGQNISLENLSAVTNLSEEIIHDAIDFWSNIGLIKVDGEDIIFLDIDRLALENVVSNSFPEENDEEELLLYISDPDYLKMFKDIDYIIRRQCVPNEKRRVLSWLYDYCVSPEMVVNAFSISYELKNKKSFSYVEGIIRSWYDKGYNSIDDILNDEGIYLSDADNSNIYMLVMDLLNYSSRDFTDEHKRIVDKWVNEYNMKEDMIRVLCSLVTRVKNPGLNYFDRIASIWYRDGLDTVEKVNDALQKKQNEIKYKKSSKSPWEDEALKENYDMEEINKIFEWDGN